MIPRGLNASSSKPCTKRKAQLGSNMVNNAYSQVEYDLSLIDDPLWRKICCYIEDMMGSLSVSQIWECKLGSFSFEGDNIEVYCPTEETAQFLKNMPLSF